MIISQSSIEKVLEAGLEKGADFAEIFVEDTYISSLSLADSQLDSATVGKNLGAGIRLFYGKEVIYVISNDLSEEALLHAARTAAQAGSSSNRQGLHTLKTASINSIHPYGKMPWETDKQQKFEFLQRADKAARAEGSEISQVIASLSEKVQNVLIANSKGLLVEDQRAYSRFSVSSIAEKDNQRETGSDKMGTLGTGEFFKSLPIEKMAKESARQAKTMLKASFAPAGKMPVLIANAFGGVIFHEACGHGLETTAVAKNASVFCGKMGEKVAGEEVTAIDDGTIPSAYGSLNIDDEGMPTQKTTLIENGILKSYIVDQMGGIKTGYAPTGSGRRESYKYAPTSRMRNTYIAAGKHEFDEMVKGIDNGLYAKKLGGGSVTPGTGDYNFAVTEAYMIRNGEIQEPVKGASLIGRGIETLSNITKVGKDLELSDGICGSVSGGVPVTVGQPAILVSELTVGGRS